jgi:Tfp pilus assembly protein PilX
MRLRRAKTKQASQSGTALLLCLFALLLLSSIGMLLYISTGTQARIAANYGNNLDAYYSAKAGLAEVRDRVNYASTPNPPAGGLADLLPKDIAGNSRGVLYVVNPSLGEAVDPTDTTNKYFDDQLCHDYNSGVALGGRCTNTPGTPNWALPLQTSLAPPGTEPALKWVRINMKTNRVVLPNYCVNQACDSAPLDTPVCWDGKTEQVSPGGTVPACDANGMQNVYMLTALAVTPGLRSNSARRLLRSEVVAPSIRPPGAITMDATSSAPVLSDGSSIPGTAVDGRPHKLDGTLSSNSSCSAVAALATDNPSASSQLTQSLDSVRKGIVDTANSSCNWDGSNQGSNVCTPGLWWVRGTNSTPRFVTSITTTTTSSGGSGSNNSGPGSGDDHHSITTTTTSSCSSSSANCYTNLDLSAPELFAASATMAPQVPAVTLPANITSPMTGGPGTQGSGSMYQSPLTTTLPDEVWALRTLIDASVNQPNYVAVSSANLAGSYGSSGHPAIVVITDTSLVLNHDLSGYGILVVPNDFEINNVQFQWTGIVLVQSGSAQFKVGSGGSGFINGALMLQAGGASAASLVSNTRSTSSNPIPFRISYSCEAIDMAFGSLPYKILGSSEVSF